MSSEIFPKAKFGLSLESVVKIKFGNPPTLLIHYFIATALDTPTAIAVFTEEQEAVTA